MVNDIEMTQLEDDNKPLDKLDSSRVDTPPQRPPKLRSASSSSLSSLGATPSVQGYIPYERPVGVYMDVVPANKPFWVEINPKEDTFNRDEYPIDEEEFSIVGIYGDIGEGDDISYECQFEDDHTAIIPMNKLFSYTNGDVALREYTKFSNGRKRLRTRRPVQVDLSSSEDDVDTVDPQFESPRAKRRRTLNSRSQKVSRRSTRANRRGQTLLSLGNGYREDESDITLSDSSGFREGTRKSTRTHKQRFSALRHEVSDFSDEYESEEPSGRTSRSSAKPRQKKAKEVFPTEEDTDFAKRHHYWCMLSSDWSPIHEDDTRNYAMCQSCSFMYHVECLGQKADRLRTGHNIIVLDEKEDVKTCVLQCGKCVGRGKNGLITMRCYACGEVGPRCGKFEYPDKSEGEELHGWNDVSKVIFRCMGCERACHFDHLSPPKADANEMQTDTDILEAYTSGHWRCNECREYEDKKVDVVLGWRPTEAPLSDDVPVDFNCEYLIKFEDESYARALWVPATWLAGVSYSMKSNYDAKNLPSISSSEDVIPDAWLRPDIVFDVRYNDDVARAAMTFRSQQDELDAITKVTSALCKWQKLKYEESIPPTPYRKRELMVATWETPPSEDSPRWEYFKAAYEEYVRGQWTHSPNYRGKKIPYADQSKPEDVIQAEFGQRMEKKDQPEWVEGGKMFDYQLEGMNWLYFQWYKQTSAILADEMGLGKTIQIIAVIATIFKEHQRWPFLVIAPNSTIENWKREFRKWAPSLRVVAWPGTTEGRKLVLCHNTTDLKTHVVIAGYGTARTTVSFLRKFAWECLIVDEGQALKNDKSDLFQELCTLNVQHRIILSGTPLQNNIRELFNIMQFLDPTQFHAQEMEEQYEQLDEQRVREIHAMLRPRFLRRTKADVLTFLPSKSEIIIPLSMSSVQKELYKSIVSQNSDLMKAITRRVDQGQTAKSNVPKLQNILMQLRKCLAHPFVQAPDLEDRNVGREQEQRALVEASGKLSFLAKILPKLKERGHRVLIFSQFLDMLDLLEDFLADIGFSYGRLDGSTATLERQHMIDEFNSPESTMDCFLLSTRAGGAGINLATADTVIVYDPDHNPHQDMQALARAHRIGQEKKVLVFRLMTRNTVEEKIYQTSKKKMVLDHLIVESIDNNEEKLDVQALLLHGLKALFEDTPEKDIKYDDNDIEKLLDRSQFEETVQQSTDEGSLGSFKTARIWANSTAQLEDLPEESNNDILEVGYWDQIIQERLSLAEAQKLAAEEEHGRGRRRASKKVNYHFDSSPQQPRTSDPFEEEDLTQLPDTIESESDFQDNDFQAPAAAEESEESDGSEDIDPALVDKDMGTLQEREKRKTTFLDDTTSNQPPYPSLETWPEIRPSHGDIGLQPRILNRMVSATSISEVMKGRGMPTLEAMKFNGPKLDSFEIGPVWNAPVPTAKPPSQLNPFSQPFPVPSIATATSRNHPSRTPPKPPRPASSILPPQHASRPSSKPRPSSGSFTHRTPITGDVPLPPCTDIVKCIACSQEHVPGRCPLRDVEIQQCPGCGNSHLHLNRTCPLLQKPEYVEMMYQRLKESSEDKDVLKAAKTYIQGVRGDWMLRKAGGRNRPKTDKS